MTDAAGGRGVTDAAGGRGVTDAAGGRGVTDAAGGRGMTGAAGGRGMTDAAGGRGMTDAAGGRGVTDAAGGRGANVGASRRDVLLMGSAFVTQAFAPITENDLVETVSMPLPSVLAFNVLRNGKPIGTHRIEFQQADDMITASIAVEIVVKLGPIPLFRYRQEARETWRGGEFESLTCDSNDDGKPFKVTMTRKAQAIEVAVSGKPAVTMPLDTIPLTHWNIQCMRRPLVNPQDGTPIASRVVQRGEEMVPLANGKMVRAHRFSLVGKPALDDWYDAHSVWTALSSKGTDGSAIEYRRTI
jgi:hypothetical protein